jgi:hypothetical protein
MKRDDMRKITESYERIGDNEGRFDIEFWQRQGEQAIFNAALDMIMDYLLIRHGYVDKPRLQRTVESFGKA